MTDTPRPQGRPPKYPLRGIEIGGTVDFHAPTLRDTRRIHKNVHQFAERNGVYFRGKMNRETRVITFTRIR